MASMRNHVTGVKFLLEFVRVKLSELTHCHFSFRAFVPLAEELFNVQVFVFFLKFSSNTGVCNLRFGEAQQPFGTMAPT